MGYLSYLRINFLWQSPFQYILNLLLEKRYMSCCKFSSTRRSQVSFENCAIWHPWCNAMVSSIRFLVKCESVTSCLLFNHSDKYLQFSVNRLPVFLSDGDFWCSLLLFTNLEACIPLPCFYGFITDEEIWHELSDIPWSQPIIPWSHRTWIVPWRWICFGLVS